MMTTKTTAPIRWTPCLPRPWRRHLRRHQRAPRRAPQPHPHLSAPTLRSRPTAAPRHRHILAPRRVRLSTRRQKRSLLDSHRRSNKRSSSNSRRPRTRPNRSTVRVDRCLARSTTTLDIDSPAHPPYGRRQSSMSFISSRRWCMLD